MKAEGTFKINKNGFSYYEAAGMKGQEEPSESMVYSREEYAKPEFWNDRFR